MKVCIVTFGCKVNQYDSEAVLEMLTEEGYIKVNTIFEADIVIFNSCAVTAESVKKLKKSLNFVRNNNKNAIVVLMGCVPQAFPEFRDSFKNVDIFIGNSNKNKIGEILKNFIEQRKRIVCVEPFGSVSENFFVSEFSDRTRAFLKIEDGCNRFCSYCIIPYARGKIRSKPINEIISEVYTLAKNGYKEITFVGINLSSYGIDIGTNLDEILKMVALVPGIERIRLGSLEPDLVTEEFLIKLSENPKFCPQFHLSLQSGSNKILKSMHRLYTKEDYINITKKIAMLFKNSTITTDLIVGFPGESEEDFNDSIEMIKKIGFLKVHVFPYSARSGTLAAGMPNQIPKNVKLLRVKKAIAEAERQKGIILNNFIGKRLSVLYENTKQGKWYEGYTSNYILVKAVSDTDIRGKIIDTYIESCEKNYCIGKLN